MTDVLWLLCCWPGAVAECVTLDSSFQSEVYKRANHPTTLSQFSQRSQDYKNDWLETFTVNTINTTYQGQNRQTASKCVQVWQVCVRSEVSVLVRPAPGARSASVRCQNIVRCHGQEQPQHSAAHNDPPATMVTKSERREPRNIITIKLITRPSSPLFSESDPIKPPSSINTPDDRMTALDTTEKEECVAHPGESWGLYLFTVDHDRYWQSCDAEEERLMAQAQAGAGASLGSGSHSAVSRPGSPVSVGAHKCTQWSPHRPYRGHVKPVWAPHSDMMWAAKQARELRMERWSVRWGDDIPNIVECQRSVWFR